jgi:hypothetical protein
VLLYGFAVHEFIVPFLIVTKHNPVLWTDNTEPVIVLHLLRKTNTRAVVPLDAERGPSPPDSLRQALTDVPVKVEG